MTTNKFGGSESEYVGFNDDPLFGSLGDTDNEQPQQFVESEVEDDEYEEGVDPLANQDYLAQLAETLQLSKERFTKGNDEDEEEIDDDSDSSESEYQYQFKTQEDLNTALETYFEERVGLPLSEAVKQLASLVEWRNTSIIEKQQAELRKEWGDDYDENFKAVVERYNTLPENMKYALDNADGARLIWARIQMERGAGQQKRSNNQPPQFQRGVGDSKRGQRYRFTQSEILAMVDRGEYDARSAEISQAYQNGQVDLNN